MGGDVRNSLPHSPAHERLQSSSLTSSESGPQNQDSATNAQSLSVGVDRSRGSHMVVKVGLLCTR